MAELRDAAENRHERPSPKQAHVRAAQASGVKLGKSHISQYVSGKTTPRADTLRFLADTLQVDEQWLAEPEGRTMRTFTKSHKLDNVLYDVRGPVADEAARMEAAGTHILKLNIGNPAPFGFRTPDEVVYDMSQQLTDTEGYSPSQGPVLRAQGHHAVCAAEEHPQRHHRRHLHRQRRQRAHQPVHVRLAGQRRRGTRASPDYPLWTACVNLAGGTAVHYVCDEDSEWYPDIDDMRSKITDSTKAIVIINPNNPTGALYPKEVLQQIVDLAREHQLIIFSDEIYDRLVMDGLQHISIASMAPDLFCVTFSGLSKST